MSSVNLLKKNVWLEFQNEHVKPIRLTILDLQGEKKHNFVFKIIFTVLVLQ